MAHVREKIDEKDLGVNNEEGENRYDERVGDWEGALVVKWTPGWNR